MKTKFIINPIAGTGKQHDITNKIKKLLEKDRFNFDVDITERPNHATELSKKAIKENYELVVAIGGDGTVSECAKALIGSETALSIIPCGSGNGFAYHFNINRKIDDAILQLNNNQIKYIDSCIVNNFPIKNYVDFEHPHQINIRKVFSKFTEDNISKKNYGIDGCSAPQYAFTIKKLGKALSNLLNSYDGKFEYSENIKLMINAILANPKFIGGSNNLDSNLIEISNKNTFF